jgi:hypothetical protein
VTARDPQGLPRSLAYDDYNNFAPRVGFAWNPKSLGGRTVFRGAYGLFYQRELANTWIDLAINDPFIRQTNINLDNDPTSPFYFARYNLARPTALAPTSPQLVFSVDPNWRDGLIHQWNFNIQQALGFGTVLQVAYVGNRGLRMPRATLPNQPDPGPGPVAARRPFANFGQINGLDSGGDAHYQGLQVQAEKRYSNGMQFIAGYTYGKCISNSDATFVGEGTSIQNGRDFHQQQGLCTQDFRQRLTTSWLYELPFGKGQRFMNTGGVANAILGGLQVGSILTLQDGFPITALCGGGVIQNGGGVCYPNATGISPNLKRSEKKRERFFNTDAFVGWPRQATVCVGTQPNTIIGHHHQLRRFSDKKFASESAISNSGLSSSICRIIRFSATGESIAPNYGVITSTKIDSRQIQFGLKLVF